MKILAKYHNTLVFDQELESCEAFDQKNNLELSLTPKASMILMDLLSKNENYKEEFITNLNCHGLTIFLTEPAMIDIDYKSCHIAFLKIWEQVELEDALHWLSTLGGAYSNLGDHSLDYAKKAGENAFKQMRVALRSSDPLVVYKCWLFVAMSLMQQKELKKSKAIIQKVHEEVKNNHEDKPVLCMCKGI